MGVTFAVGIFLYCYWSRLTQKKNDHHIYLVMEYCTGSDLSVYIKGRGRLETLDFVPRPGSGISTANPSVGDKIFWPHPASGGIDERVTRNFLGQLGKLLCDLYRRASDESAAALKFLRTMDLIHRDLKPQVSMQMGRVCPRLMTRTCCCTRRALPILQKVTRLGYQSSRLRILVSLGSCRLLPWRRLFAARR